MADESTKRPEILIVDDILANRLVLGDIITAIGCKCTTARNGDEAVKQTREQHFDMILMDLEMPVMNGFETTAAIRSTLDPEARIPIIALTAHEQDDIAADLEANGFTSVLTKPYQISQIQKLVNDFCRFSIVETYPHVSAETTKKPRVS